MFQLFRGPSLRRLFITTRQLNHENPLGLPKAGSKGRGLPVKQRIPGAKHVVLVSSGKGGVGKSTVSVNLALSLHQLGKKVGVLDADIFGPSIPTLLNLQGEPRLTSDGKLLPMSNYGVESMSMGYLIKPETPVVWRGLMVMKALQQLLFEVSWNNLDYLVIDMPPGTGDTQLSISQQVKIDGAVIVSTPQDIALIDAIKGISMFEKVQIPIIGMVQNMSHYICQNCNHEAHIFGDDGTIKEATKRGLKVLGNIPLNKEICIQSDRGKPVVMTSTNKSIKQAYREIGTNVIEFVES